MKVEQNVIRYIDGEQIDRLLLTTQAKLPDGLLDEDRKREWSADEFLRICAVLGADPWQFYEETEEKAED